MAVKFEIKLWTCSKKTFVKTGNIYFNYNGELIFKFCYFKQIIF